jgi:hypothetical protein
MVLLITDAGLKSDDARLEGQLTTATMTLKHLHEIGLAIFIGCLGVGGCIVARKWLFKRSG